MNLLKHIYNEAPDIRLKFSKNTRIMNTSQYFIGLNSLEKLLKYLKDNNLEK
jgi:hypothetical protein